MKPWFPIVATIAFSSASPVAQAQARRSPNFGESYTVEFEYRRWRADLFSELRLSRVGEPGTTLNSSEDLGIERESVNDFHVKVRLARRLKARGSYVKLEYQGDTGAPTDLCVAGLCITAGTSIRSVIELEETRGGAEFDLFTGQYGFLAVAGEYGRYKASPSFESGDLTAEQPMELQFPLFGLKARAYLTPALAVSLEGMGWKNDDGVWTDFEASATYSGGRNFGFTYGYRNSYVRFKSVEVVGDRALMRVRGQYFGFIVRF
jgi:hypothetical protein